MRRILWIATLLAVIAFAVVYDRLDRPQGVDLVNTPPTTYATTSLPPHPATTPGHP